MTIRTTPNVRTMKKEAGFTLIELSIVLVIIGLIVGGVLVGQDLIRAAEVRAQVSQVEKLNTAVNTFRGKFNAIPGDMSSSTATQFGFATGTGCDGSAGKRDGNGLVEYGAATSTTNVAGVGGAHESGLIWQDLSSSTGGNLIEGSVTGIACTSLTIPAASNMLAYFPTAKIGRGQYVSVYNYGGYNWWNLQGWASITTGTTITPTTPMSVMQAYNIDKKMDDGIAATGNVVASYISGSTWTVAPSTGTATTAYCYETTTNTYNVSINNGQDSKCALGFRFQ